MTEEKKIDLGAEGLLGGATESPADANQSQGDDFVEHIEKMLLGLQDSIASFHIGLRVLGSRIAQLEQYTAYLLEKDPVLGPKVKAMAEAAKAEAQTKE